jgi:hypothetical protein
VTCPLAEILPVAVGIGDDQHTGRRRRDAVIDAGPVEMTRRDVENITGGDWFGCMAALSQPRRAHSPATAQACAQSAAAIGRISPKSAQTDNVAALHVSEPAWLHDAAAEQDGGMIVGQPPPLAVRDVQRRETGSRCSASSACSSAACCDQGAHRLVRQQRSGRIGGARAIATVAPRRRSTSAPDARDVDETQTLDDHPVARFPGGARRATAARRCSRAPTGAESAT